MSNSQNKKNEQQNNLCTTLTEQLKKGELEQGWHYIECIDLPKRWIDIDYYRNDCYEDEGFCKGFFDHNDWRGIDKVLAPVPSYGEWQAKDSQIDYLQQKVSVLESENQQLKTQIAKLTEIVGVLPSNHSVGNLGYKIKNQRHEINNRLKEINKLKELLKTCRDEINPYIEVIGGKKTFKKLIDKIDEVLK